MRSHLVPITCDSKCQGCEPCTHDDHGNPVRHCETRKHCTSHLDSGDYVCPDCLNRIRTNLAGIVQAKTLMPDEAEYAGIDSEAAAQAGPTANPVLTTWRRIDADAAGLWVEDHDQTDAYTMLGMRERMIREDLGHDETVLISEHLTGVVTYLDWVLTDLARREDAPIVVGDLMSESSRLLSHLEAVLHDSRAPEKGAPCPVCGTPEKRGPSLVKVYGNRVADDRWKCPSCHTKWDDETYRLRVAKDHLAHAERLTASQMHEAHKIAEGTLRRWANGWIDHAGNDVAPCVRKRGKDQQGRQMYDVGDAKAARDGAPRHAVA